MPRKLLQQWRQSAQEELGLPVDAPDESLSATRSQCPHCHTTIAWYDNLPLLSWLLLRGKCRHCSAPISVRYLLLELAGVCLGVGAYALFGFKPAAVAAAIAGFLLLWLSVIDIEHQLLPDTLVYPLLWVGLISATQHYFVSLPIAVWGGLTGFLVLAVPSEAYAAIRGRQGMGPGDMKLLMALGAFVGPWGVVYSLLAACLSGIGGNLWLRFRTGTAPERLPFGQWLAGGGALVFILQSWGALRLS